MPCRFDPNSRMTLTLPGDADLPEASRAEFYSRVLTGRQWLELESQYDALFSKTDSFRSSVTKRFELLRQVLVGWNNVKDPANEGQSLPFDPAKCEDILSPQECNELIVAALAGGKVSRTDQKNSASPLSSNTDNSANTADPASA